MSSMPGAPLSLPRDEMRPFDSDYSRCAPTPALSSVFFPICLFCPLRGSLPERRRELTFSVFLAVHTLDLPQIAASLPASDWRAAYSDVFQCLFAEFLLL